MGYFGGGEDDNGDLTLTTLPIKFKSYCVFCLQYLKEGSGCFRNYVESNPRKIRSFRELLSYLTGEEQRTVIPGGDEDDELGRGRKGNVEKEEKLPPMCQNCYEIMGDVYQLHKELIKIQHLIQKQTLIARMTVLKTTVKEEGRAQSRRERFQERIGLSRWEGEKIRKVVDRLHNAMIGEGTNSVRIPMVLPVHLMPKTALNDMVLTEERRYGDTFQVKQQQRTVKVETEAKGVSRRHSSGEDPDWHDEGTFDAVDSLFEMDVDEDENNEEEEETNRNTDKQSKLPSIFTDDEATQGFSSTMSSSNVISEGRHPRKTITRLVHGKTNSQVCDLCGKLSFLTDIIQHLETHGVKDYICKCLNPACRYAFSCQPRMDFHLSNVKRCRIAAKVPQEKGMRGRIRQCDTCGFQNSNLVTFRNHLENHEHEMEGKELTCPIQDCGKRFSLRQTVEHHLTTHNLRPPKAFQNCTICSVKLRVEQVSPHLAEVHGIGILDQFPCKLCKFIYPDKNGLVKHLACHGEEGWICDMCEDTPKFTRHYNLVKHYFDNHQIGQQHRCEIDNCNRIFFNRQTFKDHQKKLHSDAGTARKKKEKCDLCGESSLLYISQTDVYAHKIKVHGVQPFICKTCGKIFNRKCSMIKHERQKHDGYQHEATHKCTQCDLVCWNRTQLEDHVYAKHTNAEQRRHLCKICGKGFTWSGALTKHHNIHHLGIRHVCEICGEKFVDIKILTDHLLIHTGERPHNCPICNQPFRQKQAMRNHIKSHKRWGTNFKTTGPRHNVKRRVFKNKKD